MASRLDLQALFEDIAPSEVEVYYTPPPSVQMTYPCIVYGRTDLDTKHASNKPYAHKWAYQVTVMDRKEDSPTVDVVRDLPLTSLVRSFVADNLHHTVFKTYF